MMDARPLWILSAALLVATSGCGDPSNAGTLSPSALLALDCQVTFELVDPVSVEALTYSVEHNAEIGAFVSGQNADVECISQVPDNAGNSVNDWEGVLHIGRIAPRAFEGPVSLDRCRYTASRQPEVTDFMVTVTDATQDSSNLPPFPSVEITNISCDSSGTPTSTSTTSTLPCDDLVDCEFGEPCAAGSCIPENRYEIDFAIDDAVDFGSVQLEVGYSSDLGSFVGTQNSTQCRLLPGLNAFPSFNDEYALDSCETGKLGVAIISPTTGIAGPTTLFTCDFDSRMGAPRAADFSITVVDASDIRLQPIPLDVRVSDTRPARSAGE